MIALHLALLVCALAAALLVVRYDLYEREPWFMLVAAALAGAVVMHYMGYLEDATLDRLGGPDAGPAVMAAVAAVEEEAVRLLVVAAIALLVPSQLNDPMDGIVYGSIVGLGMAIEESRWMLTASGASGWVLPGSEPVRLLGHLVLGGITGFAVGLARLGIARWPAALAGCVVGSIGIHFGWDWIAFSAAARGILEPWQTLAAIALMLSGMFGYAALVVRGSALSRRVFAPASARTLWGWPFVRRSGPPAAR